MRKACRGGQVIRSDEFFADRRPGGRGYQIRWHNPPRRQDGDVDVDHPDIEAYVDWKVVEEQKVAALVAGSKLAQTHMGAVMEACQITDGLDGDERFDPRANKALKEAIVAARKVMIPENYVQRVIQFAKQGYTEIEFKTYDTDWDSEAYLTVAGQNSNNSVRVSNDFCKRSLIRVTGN